MNNNYDVCLICPVRKVTDGVKKAIEDYVSSLEASGKTVYYPARDTNQENDPTGFRICSDNRMGIKNSKEIHIWWVEDSEGKLFDLGMTFAYEKPLKIANPDDIPKTEKKSFALRPLQIRTGRVGGDL